MGRQPKYADDSFLPGMTGDEIKDLYDAEPDKRNAQKLQVAYHYKSGKSVSEAADAACTSYENARRWILGMRRNGPDALRHRKPPGAARMLTRDERVRLVLDVHRGPRACGFEASAWTYALIHKHVRKKFKVEIGYRAVVYLLHKLRIVTKIGDGEHLYYEETDPPGRIRLPTADDVKAKKKVLSPEMRSRLPPRLANSDLPYEYLANPPELLLKE